MYFIEDYFHQIINQGNISKKVNPSDDIVFKLIESLGILNTQLLVVIEEILYNSQEHGKSPIELYYHKNIDHLLFGVLDYGSGIHTTIPNNTKLSDVKGKSSTAILRLGLEEGITGTSVIGRGMGLQDYEN